MGAEVMMVGSKGMWGTWEELILGGAVLRHGSQNWNVVASEIRARTLYPSYFTPEVCKAKYEELRKRYLGCAAWFEELRKRRVAQLKRELERSEDSIGSLESKIRSLKGERKNFNQADCLSSRTQSPASILRSDGNESFCKEDTSKDGLSAGSFTQDARTELSPDRQLPALGLAVDNVSKLEVSASSELNTGLNVVTEPAEPSSIQCGTPRKRRGKRKRKDCGRDVKEGSMGDNDNLGSTNFVSSSRCNETSTSDSGQTNQFCSKGGPNTGANEMNSNSCMEVLDSFMSEKAAFVFRHRLDSQKRARYKRIIKQHRDFEMIKAGILSRSIKSTGELYRDLLLLANNALIFYSKRTKEYKSALSLRDVVLKACRERYKATICNKATSACFPLAPMYNPPVKPRSARPRPHPHLSNRSLLVKVDNVENTGIGSPCESLKQSDVDANTPPVPSLLKTKKGFKKPGKAKNGLVKPVPKTPAAPKDRKGSRHR